MSRPRSFKDPTARSSLIIALVLHGVAFLIFFTWAAKTGKLDPVLRAMNVVQVNEKKPAPKPEEKKETLDKPVDVPKDALTPPVAVASAAPTQSAPSAAVAPAVAPPAAEAPEMDFSDGAKEVISSTDAVTLLYKSQIEYAVKSNWQKPENVADNEFIVEASITIDPNGKILRSDWIKGSGNSPWDESVRKAIANTKIVGAKRPAGFPERVVVRFDVIPAMDPLIQ